MFIDTSVIVAILSGEDDAARWAGRIEQSAIRVTSPLVVLEAVMRLSTKLLVEPAETEAAIAQFLAEAGIEVVSINPADGNLAVRAFAAFGKGRGHPAQLNLADCLSYACAKGRGLSLLYKGNDFAQTDLA